MNLNKKICTLILTSSALIAYNTFDAKAEASKPITTVEESKEISPFDNSVTTTTTTTTTTTEKIKIEDIQPAVLIELKPEIKEIIKETTTVKESLNEDGAKVEIKETTTDKVIVDEKGVTDTVTEEIKVQEVKKETLPEEVQKEELPKLEEIQLPVLEKKTINNEPVKIEVSSQRIPASTVIPLKLESSINSITSEIGDQFNASITSDIIIGDNIILPAGTIVRGTVGKIQKAGMLIKEAKIQLLFDHIVTPAGKQVPIYAYLAGNQNVNYEGYIVGGTSYKEAFKKDAYKSKDILVNTTTYGVDKGLEYLGGVPVVLTAPLCAIGGTLGGGGYLIGKSVYNLFVKGAEIILEQGSTLNITLYKALDIPIN